MPNKSTRRRRKKATIKRKKKESAADILTTKEILKNYKKELGDVIKSIESNYDVTLDIMQHNFDKLQEQLDKMGKREPYKVFLQSPPAEQEKLDEYLQSAKSQPTISPIQPAQERVEIIPNTQLPRTTAIAHSDPLNGEQLSSTLLNDPFAANATPREHLETSRPIKQTLDQTRPETRSQDAVQPEVPGQTDVGASPTPQPSLEQRPYPSTTPVTDYTYNGPSQDVMRKYNKMTTDDFVKALYYDSWGMTHFSINSDSYRLYLDLKEHPEYFPEITGARVSQNNTKMGVLDKIESKLRKAVERIADKKLQGSIRDYQANIEKIHNEMRWIDKYEYGEALPSLVSNKLIPRRIVKYLSKTSNEKSSLAPERCKEKPIVLCDEDEVQMTKALADMYGVANGEDVAVVFPGWDNERIYGKAKIVGNRIRSEYLYKDGNNTVQHVLREERWDAIRLNRTQVETALNPSPYCKEIMESGHWTRFYIEKETRTAGRP